MDEFKIQGLRFKVVGVTFEGRDAHHRKYQETPADQRHIYLEREPSNQYDVNAIRVMGHVEGLGDMHLGYIGKQYTVNLAPMMDGGTKFNVMVTSLGFSNSRPYMEIQLDQV